MFFEIVGWIGTFLLISAYFMVSAKKLPPQTRTYQLMNLFGAAGVGISVLIKGAYPAFVLEVIWAAIAIYGIFKSSKR